MSSDIFLQNVIAATNALPQVPGCSEHSACHEEEGDDGGPAVLKNDLSPGGARHVEEWRTAGRSAPLESRDSASATQFASE